MLVAWGIQKADEQRLESYVDATDLGLALYEGCGFIKAERVDFKDPGHTSSDRQMALQKELLPFHFWPMWRPVGGKSRDGETMPPWFK